MRTPIVVFLLPILDTATAARKVSRFSLAMT